MSVARWVDTIPFKETRVCSRCFSLQRNISPQSGKPAEMLSESERDYLCDRARLQSFCG